MGQKRSHGGVYIVTKLNLDSMKQTLELQAMEKNLKPL